MAPPPPGRVRAARHRGRRPGAEPRARLAVHPGPERGRRGGEPAQHRLLLRRERARARRAGRAGQPAEGVDRPDPAAGPARGALGRGPDVLHQLRVRPDRHPARGPEAGHRRRGGRLDDHPAVREERDGRRRTLVLPQVPRTDHLREDHAGVLQGPGARGLPQQHLPRTRRVRHPGRLAGVLQQARRAAHAGRGRDDRRPDPGALAMGPGSQPRRVAAPLELRHGRHGLLRLAPAGRAGRGALPDRGPAPQAGQRGPRRRPRSHLLRGQGRAPDPRHRRGRPGHRGAPDPDDDRPEGPAGRRRRRAPRDEGQAGEPAHRRGVRRSAHRGRPLLLRRRQRRRPGLRAGVQAGRLDVQAVRHARRPRARPADRHQHAVRRAAESPARRSATSRAPTARAARSSRP